MLFSNQFVASFINYRFEPVWEMVRPVPIVKIDFGNGEVITRTLHGNIATYVCAADGQALDVLPGIYEPKVYTDRLRQFQLLANYVDQLGAEKRAERLKEYHENQADAIRKNAPGKVFADQLDMAKLRVEGKVKAILVDSSDRLARLATTIPETNPTAKALGHWKALVEDTAQNETVRRLQVHDALAARPNSQPATLKKWLYKDVLHADLDDPHLGLGAVLFGDYPFKDATH